MFVLGKYLWQAFKFSFKWMVAKCSYIMIENGPVPTESNVEQEEYDKKRNV
jgi:hypothetical protein